MLTELTIRDFAIIDELRIEFRPGFNVLTGETGAGKSILIDAVGAVLGDRVGPDVVRTGAKTAWVEATFEIGPEVVRSKIGAILEEFGVEDADDVLVLSREVHASGRTVARVNGRTATVGLLNRLGVLLVDVHGQSDHLSLLRPAEQLDMLDQYAGVMEQRAALAAQVEQLRALRARLEEISSGARERARQVDLLRFQVSEIAAAELRPDEEDELLAERSVLMNAERLAVQAATVHTLIAGADEPEMDALPALSALGEAASNLSDIAAIDETMRPLADRLNELVYLLEDISAETRAYRDRIEADPARLSVIEDRIDLLNALKRKYGPTIADVIAFGESASAELAALTGDEVDVEALGDRIRRLSAAIGEQAERLSKARSKAAKRLARDVETAMAELHMGRARFEVDIRQQVAEQGVPASLNGTEPQTYAVDATGIDRVEFLIAPNAGEALKPLGRIASGGETARLMLAMKSILSNADATPTLIFDEVDVGVGGRSGQYVGEKLWRLAQTHQVLVITHLPQIAAFATHHLRIAKGERDGRVVSRVEPIATSERVDELAAMLDGLPVTDVSRQSALEMLRRVEQWTSRQSEAPPARQAVLTGDA